MLRIRYVAFTEWSAREEDHNFEDGMQTRKMYHCPWCEKSYLQISGLSRHKSNIHGKFAHIFICPYCSAKLKNKQSLESHLSKTHADVHVSRKKNTV